MSSKISPYTAYKATLLLCEANVYNALLSQHDANNCNLLSPSEAQSLYAFPQIVVETLVRSGVSDSDSGNFSKTHRTVEHNAFYSKINTWAQVEATQLMANECGLLGLEIDSLGMIPCNYYHVKGKALGSHPLYYFTADVIFAAFLSLDLDQQLSVLEQPHVTKDKTLARKFFFLLYEFAVVARLQPQLLRVYNSWQKIDHAEIYDTLRSQLNQMHSLELQNNSSVYLGDVTKMLRLSKDFCSAGLDQTSLDQLGFSSGGSDAGQILSEIWARCSRVLNKSSN